MKNNFIYGSHYRQIEILITTDQSTQTVILIPDQPDLRYARVLNIEAYTVSDLSNSLPSGYPVIADNLINKIALTLETNDADVDPEFNTLNKVNSQGVSEQTPGRFTSTQQNYQFMPLASLHNIQNASNNAFQRAVRYYPDMYVTWQKCQLLIAPGGLGNNANIAVVLGITYTWLTVSGKMIPRT